MAFGFGGPTEAIRDYRAAVKTEIGASDGRGMKLGILG